MSGDTVYRGFRVAYDGRPFRGFQRQPDQRTIEGELFQAFDALGVDIRSDAAYAAAGRTDAGVSAAAQTITVRCPSWLDAPALNGKLPDAIMVWAQTTVPDEFHPQYDAQLREYTYRHYAPEIDLERVDKAADLLAGVHDFRHLTSDRSNTERRLDDVVVTRDDPFLRIAIRAPGFLRHQVRRIVTLLDDIGRGDRSFDQLETVLAGDPIPGHHGIHPADPRPLVLTAVAYENVSFTSHPQAGDKVHDRFRNAAIEHRGISRAMRSIAAYIK